MSTSIAAISRLAITHTPVLLFDCTLSDGTALHWCTHKVSFEGRTYQARVLRHDLFDIRAMAEDGLDGISRLSLVLANADDLYSGIERAVGWKGSKLLVRFLYFDLSAQSAVSEVMTLFRGVGGPLGEMDETTLRLSFQNRLHLQRVLLPELRIQKRCPWRFPRTEEQRVEARQGDDYSFFQRCGYSAGLPDGLGSLDGSGVAFTQCDYTRGNCEERGMFSLDSAQHPTRRFAGIAFLPPTITVRAAGAKASETAAAQENEARYNDFVPILYGTAWYQPPIIFGRNDGNLLHLEVLLGQGEMDAVLSVVVNDIEIPRGRSGANMSGTGWFNVVTLGGRTGAFNLDFTDQRGQPLGDPYGSLAVLSVVVPNRVLSGSALPRIRVFARGVRLPQYDADGQYLQRTFTANPAWVLLDLLRRSGWSEDEVDLSSFARSAAFCDETITTSGSPTATRVGPRAQCNLVLRKRRSAADWIRGVRAGASLTLAYNERGLLALQPEGQMAQQQGEKRDSSNSRNALDGGWPAYEFGDGTDGYGDVLRRENGAATLRVWSRSGQETFNRLTVEFQDEWNQYQQDSLSLVDIDDAVRIGQETTGTHPALGLPNARQAFDVLQLQLHKSIRGNCFIEFETGLRGVGLRPGDLITFSWRRLGWTRQAFRIVAIQPGMNLATLRITAQWHDDVWYQSGGSAGDSGDTQPHWGSGLPRPVLGTATDMEGLPVFGITEGAALSGGEQLALEVNFVEPGKLVSGAPAPPLLSLQAVVDAANGNLSGGRFWFYALSSVDTDGVEGELSLTVVAEMPAGHNGTVRLTGIETAPNVAEVCVYRGSTANQLLRIARLAAPVSEFADTGLPASEAAPVDRNFDHVNWYWRLERRPATACLAADEQSLQVADITFLENEYRDDVLRIISGRGVGQERRIKGNEAQRIRIAGSWDVIPDSGSRFVIAEGTWTPVNSSPVRPAHLPVPLRPGATVHITGRSANALNAESEPGAALVSRHQIQASGQTGIDYDVPPAPRFALTIGPQGSLELAGIAFPSLVNTSSIYAGLLTLHYWDERDSPSSLQLSAGCDADTQFLASAGLEFLQEGDLLQVGAELCTVLAPEEGAGVVQVLRGAFGSTPQEHAEMTPVHRLKSRSQVLAFSPFFFGSPASGGYHEPIALPFARLAATELVMSNRKGKGAIAEQCFTNTTDFGLRTQLGMQISLQVQGPLGVQDNVVPPLIVDQCQSVVEVFGVMAQPPVGGAVQVEVTVDGQAYCELTFSAGNLVSTVVSGFGLAPLLQNSQLGLNVLQVPTTVDGSAGRDLTVTLRL